MFCIDDGESKMLMKKLLEYYAQRYKKRFWINKDIKGKRPTLEKGPETKKVAVALEEKIYADVIQAVKSKFKPEDIGAVLSIRKGKGEEAVIRVKGDSKVADEVVVTLAGKLQGAKVDKLGRPPKKVLVLVKDLEVGVKGTEVTDAIEWYTNEKCLGEPTLRPAYGETQIARVPVADKAARLLVDKKSIRIGYVNCRIVRSQPDDKCYRCMEKGHIAKHCKGLDKRKVCFKCGEEGHKAAKCKGEDLFGELMRRLS